MMDGEREKKSKVHEALEVTNVLLSFLYLIWLMIPTVYIFLLFDLETEECKCDGRNGTQRRHFSFFLLVAGKLLFSFGASYNGDVGDGVSAHNRFSLGISITHTSRCSVSYRGA